MRQAGITDTDLLNFMVGHEMPYGEAYDKFDADTIRREYVKAEPFLTVTVNPEIQELQEIERLRGELKAKGIDGRGICETS